MDAESKIKIERGAKSKEDGRSSAVNRHFEKDLINIMGNNRKNVKYVVVDSPKKSLIKSNSSTNEIKIGGNDVGTEMKSNENILLQSIGILDNI